MTVKRILFVAETVTLAHLSRILVFVEGLAKNNYECHIACDKRYQKFIANTNAHIHTINSLSGETFLKNLQQGKPLFDFPTLKSHIEEDLKLIQEVKPDLVVGDLRSSLAVSTALQKVPYINIINAHWSPYVSTEYHLIQHPMINLLGDTVAQKIFQLMRPLAFAAHTLPLNRARKFYGLPPISYDLKKIYTAGDYVGYVDIPEMFSVTTLPSQHRFLGPVIWGPAVDYPVWWNSLPADKPNIYVNLGTSGDAVLLEQLVDLLATYPANIMLGTTGLKELKKIPDNFYVAEFLPGIEAAQRSALVICNGGCGGSKQALAAGVPVLGVITNMDQWLTMQGVIKLGAGSVALKQDVTKNILPKIINNLWNNSQFKNSALQAQQIFQQYDVKKNFAAWVAEII